MTPEEKLKIAYTLLPPPLSALPAKYWASISLLLHSYSVASTFEIFVKGYETYTNYVPSSTEAFIVGFLHDLGQKLKIRGKHSDEAVISWAEERLQHYGFTPGEARIYAKYLYTNPAETRSDPLFSREVWTLLWLADRIQGVSNPIDLVSLLHQARRDLSLGLNLKLINITLPQPFLRTLISKMIYEELVDYATSNPVILLPVSSPMGVAIITDDPTLKVTLSWDDLRKGFRGKGLLTDTDEVKLEWNMHCCEDKKCAERCGKKSKPEECKRYGFRKRDCEKGFYPGQRGNSYKIILRYYGFNRKVEGDIVLPKDVGGMFQGVELVGVKFLAGNSVCPICGVKTPVGMPVNILGFFKDLTIQQWARRLYPGNVNRLMQEAKTYAVDPLCLGDVIVRRTLGTDVLLSLSLRTLVPAPVLEEIGFLSWVILNKLERGIPRSSSVSRLFYGEGWDRSLGDVVRGFSTYSRDAFFVYDMFSTSVYLPYRNPLRRHLDEWVKDIVTAGVLTGWGIYPLTVSHLAPSVPPNTLLTYYKGRKPLYDMQPSDPKLGVYTPYVSMVMASLAELNRRKGEGQQLPAFLEVLDYPPEHSPVLLEYSSPSLYSVLESLRLRLWGEVVSVGG